MESPHNLGGNYWGTLINTDKSPAPLFEHLCLGIAQLVVSGRPLRFLRGKGDTNGSYESRQSSTHQPGLMII
jgi:hypothetical protein